ncbi:MAG: hypothetical protein OXE17_00110 [Chloroflexi bacterium]|nr:hypothetical protein [Chloroflexota bacterium]
MEEAVMCTASHRFLTIIQSLSIIALLAAFIFRSSRVDRRLKALRDQVRASLPGTDDGGGHDQAYGGKDQGEL